MLFLWPFLDHLSLLLLGDVVVGLMEVYCLCLRVGVANWWFTPDMSSFKSDKMLNLFWVWME